MSMVDAQCDIYTLILAEERFYSGIHDETKYYLQISTYVH